MQDTEIRFDKLGSTEQSIKNAKSSLFKNTRAMQRHVENIFLIFSSAAFVFYGAVSCLYGLWGSLACSDHSIMISSCLTKSTIFMGCILSSFVLTANHLHKSTDAICKAHADVGKAMDVIDPPQDTKPVRCAKYFVPLQPQKNHLCHVVRG